MNTGTNVKVAGLTRLGINPSLQQLLQRQIYAVITRPSERLEIKSEHGCLDWEARGGSGPPLL